MTQDAPASLSPFAATDAGLEARFEQAEHTVRLENYRRTAQLAIVFMMLGCSLDLMVFPDQALEFFLVRVLCSLLLWAILVLMSRFHSPASLKIFVQCIGMLPLVSILWMIQRTGGGDSTYYAGLNLVLLAASLLLRWPFRDSVLNSCLCFGGYLIVALCSPATASTVFNNAYFIGVTAIFASTGTFFYNRLRCNEFSLRDQLERSRRDLEENHLKLQALDEAKTRFFANVSHELRTPLTLILGPLERLKNTPAVSRDERSLALVQMLEDNGLRLLRLINDLLDLVRLDSDAMPVRSERLKLQAFVDGMCASLQYTAESKQIHLRSECVFEDQAEIWMDRGRLEKIVLNLVMNAIKFTPRGGRIDLNATLEHERLLIVVRDTGTGIKADEIDHIFERFWQADMSSRRKHGGVGIGLALVKGLVDGLGGSIRVESEHGHGTTFVVTLPINGPAAHEEQTTVPNPEEDAVESLYQKARLSGISDSDDAGPSIRNDEVDTFGAPVQPMRTILVADDEPGLRRYLVNSLEDFRVIEARDGLEAWAKARQFRPDLILLDLMMPQMDGLEVTRRLRAHGPTAHTPIVLVTANAESAPRLEALGCGVNEFLTKPFSSVELNARLHNLLRQKDYERDLAASKQDLEIAHEELKDNESRLLQAERLSALGRMSAGIIHEVNNPLNYTRTALYALKSFSKQLDESERADYNEVIADATEGVDRVIKIVSDLRSFTKGNTSAMTDLVLINVIEAARRLISNDLTGIELAIQVPDDVSIHGNENQLCQVFVNLMQNAASFVLAAKKRNEQPRIVVKAARSAGGLITVTVWDNGSGIAEEDLPKVFDPFFTRRDVGAGMGLGLSICHQILQSHGAKAEVRSERDCYTEFSLCFPSPALR